MCVFVHIFLSDAIVYIAKTDDDDDAPPAHLTVDLFLFFRGDRDLSWSFSLDRPAGWVEAYGE